MGAMTKRSPLHIGFLADPRSVHTRRWLSALLERGYRVSLLIGTDDELDERLPRKVEVCRYRRFGPRRVPFLSSLQGRRALRALLAQVRPDILHAHYVSRYGWQGRLSGFRPFVVTAWGSDLLVTPRQSLRARLWARATLHGADLVTVPSEALAAVARGFGARPDRLRRIAFGVDTSRFVPAVRHDDALRPLALAGRRIVFSPRAIKLIYRQETVVAALAHLPDDVVAVLPGRNADAGLRNELQRLTDRLGLGERVVVVDEISDELMLALYQAADVVVSVPESDGLPVSVLEAMACGTPVLISDLPGPREALGPDADRALVRVPSPPPLACAIQEVLDMPAAEREALVGRLRARAVDLFDFERNLDAMDKLYTSLVRAR